MKLVTYAPGKEHRVGVVHDDVVVDVIEATNLAARGRLPGRGLGEAVERILRPAGAPRDMIGILARGVAYQHALDGVTRRAAESHTVSDVKALLTPLAEARLRAPISRPGKIVCVGLNYADHAREQGKEPPSFPIFFLKSANTMIGPGQPIRMPPNSEKVDYEAELAVVIGKGGRRIRAERAWEHVAGYMILNDVTARDFQASDRQWFRAKSCDTFAPTGPWVTTADDAPNPRELAISLTVNGETRQDSNTRNLIFNVDYLVSYLSQSMTWEVGDVLSTGTPAGVGVFRNPPVFLKPGDSVSITIERIGTLTNPVTGPVR